VKLDPGSGGAAGLPRRITHDASPKFTFSLTGDGEELVYSTYSGPKGQRHNDVVFLDGATGEQEVWVSFDATTTSVYPRLSDDGSLLSWRTFVDREQTAWVAPTDDPVGTELCRGCIIVDFFSDNQHALVDWGRRLSRVDITDGSEATVLELGEDRRLIDTDLSKDDRWISIQTGESDGRVAVFVVAIQEPPLSPREWIEIARDERWNGSPRWSADGRVIYFLSDRDDFLCVWGQPLEPDSKQPVGEPFPVAHAHGSAMKMMPFAKHMWSLEVGGDRLVFNAGELTGDVYTAMLPDQ
jgi:Tol biopolymer transport system component